MQQISGKFNTGDNFELKSSISNKDEKGSKMNSSFSHSISSGSLNCDKCQSQPMAEILIVDDSMFNLIPLELILSEIYGLKVDKASNGLQAVNLYR